MKSKSGRPFTEMEAILRQLVRSSLVALFFIVLTLGAYICTRYLESSAVLILDRNSPQKSMLTTETVDNYTSETSQNLQSTPKTIDIPLNCSLGHQSRTCPANYYPSNNILIEDKDHSLTPPPSCPDYFHWIYEDLWPWRESGITREMVMSARKTATFRLVILDGKAYVEKYRGTFQTRDVFTKWGILQLLRRYPGKLPDLDLMFDCLDLPVIHKETFSGPKFPAPPPLFRYSGNDSTFDIVFPDWSFWGWPEINIKPWEPLLKDLQEGTKKSRWIEREPYAYWKGNPYVAATRKDLLKCNVSDKQDWNARVYIQDWQQEMKEGFKKSELASQCIHRFKIYVEGCSWSVSQKYILACDSMTLLIKPIYYDFFMRSLMPLKHYWPIKDDDKCRSIKHAVDWGNSHQQEAQAIGKAGSSFIQDELKMEYIYDYMFHLLSEYAKLLKYKPTVPKGAVEVCSESMACPAQGLAKKYMIDSLAKGPALSEPCTMPSPYDPASLHSVIETKDDGIKQVDIWEKGYWQSHNKQM